MDIDPIRYGAMWQKVEDYDRRFAELNRKIDKMEKSLEELLALANQSKGSLWLGKAIVGSISAAFVLLVDWFFKK